LIIETITVSPYETNCYVCATARGGDAVVIDPGDNSELILRRVQALSLNITCLILTHGHRDHAGALKELKQALGVEIAVHAADADLLNDDFQAAMLGLRFPCPPQPDRLLEDGQEIVVGGLTFSVLHTPGHSRGSICLLGDGLVFTGDTLFQAGIGRTDLPGGSYPELIKSIEMRLLSLPDDTIVYPGHGSPTTVGDERQHNPFLR